MPPFLFASAAMDTQAMQIIDVKTRLNLLNDILEIVKIKAQNLNVDCNARPWGLFAMPEYFIAKPAQAAMHNIGEARHVEESEKELYLVLMKFHSRRHPGLIILPGTIAWRKPLQRPVDRMHHRKGPNAGQPKAETRTAKALRSVGNVATWQGKNILDTMNGGPASPSNPTVLTKLAGLATNSFQYMARNTAYILYDGEIRLKYNKQGDFHEVLDNSGTVHIPGSSEGYFTVPSQTLRRDLTFGLEICLDHCFGSFARDAQRLGQVDVQILCSAQTRFNINHAAVRQGGYFLHSCSNRAEGGLWINQAGFHKLEPDAYTRVLRYDLTIWQVNIT